MNRYYSILRPVGIGTYPKEGMEAFRNFDQREYVDEIKREAWGWLDYSRELTAEEMKSYDLVAKPKRKVNQYRAMRDRQHKEFAEVPIGAAFSDKQFREMMDGWNLDPDKDLDKIYKLPGGAFIQKKDAPMLHEVTARHGKELKDAVAEDQDGSGFIRDMFYAELCDHEYIVSYDLEETLDAIPFTVEEINADDRLLHGLDLAIKEIEAQEDW